MGKENMNLDFQDPGVMGDELLNMPGFVNELKDYTLAVSPRPNPPLAFAGALAMLAHLTGRSYVNERGAHTNLYLAALAPTAMGKEEPRVTNKELAEAVGIRASVPDSVASGEALEDAVAQSPSLLLQCDEADALLTAMRGSDSRAARMNEMVLRFFSEAKSGHALRLKANQVSPHVIPLPHLTLFATGIPKFVYAALTAKALENGLLGRCLFIETDAFCPLGDPQARELPAACVATAQMMAEKEKRFNETCVLEPVIVIETPEAKRKLAEERVKIDAFSRQLFESKLFAASALYCRLYEKVIKLASLWAISENPEEPTMTPEAVEWALRFADHITRKMLFEAQFSIGEGAFDRLKRRAIGIMTRNGGQMTQSHLIRSLKIDVQTMTRLVRTLHMGDEIEEERIDRRKIVLTLKKAS